jgi:PAS domain-containing protein/putative methionine-R-sulfoxide reductase with GAF domain
VVTWRLRVSEDHQPPDREVDMARPAPTPDELMTFLAAVRTDRQLLQRYLNGEAGMPEELAEVIDELGERLLVADEELRAQNEELAQSTRRLDLLVAVHQELFDNAPAAYLQSDEDGVLQRMNTAAARLLRRDLSARSSTTLVSLVRPEDRKAVRTLIGTLRTARVSDEVKPAEVVVVRPSGTQVPAVIIGRRSSDVGSARALLHFEIQERRTEATSAAEMSALTRIAEAAEVLAQQQTRLLTLEQVVQLAKAAVPHCDEAGVSVARAHRRVETPAATGELAARCDQLQYDLGEGPCLHAIDDTAPVLVSDVATDKRWPRFGPRAAALGVGSMLVLPLAAQRGTLSALNMYSQRTRAFDEEDQLIARAYATHAAIALAHVELESNLRTGLITRQEIGQAVGILMERHRLTASAAFEVLVEASQSAHLKLRDIAARVVETGEDPPPLERRKAATDN